MNKKHLKQIYWIFNLCETKSYQVDWIQSNFIANFSDNICSLGRASHDCSLVQFIWVLPFLLSHFFVVAVFSGIGCVCCSFYFHFVCCYYCCCHGSVWPKVIWLYRCSYCCWHCFFCSYCCYRSVFSTASYFIA